MNEEQEILVRQSKWSGRRIVLFYWFAIIFLGTSAAVGLGTTVLAPSYKVEAADPNHDGIFDPWGPDDCDGSGCHDEEVDAWEETWHAIIGGEEYLLDDPQNGSRVNYNSTHYWRIPNTMTNTSQPTDYTNIQYWTYNELFNASGQQCCMTTRWTNVTVLNSTTGAVIFTNTSTMYENFTNNIWDMGVSCAACHKSPGVIPSLGFTTCSSCHTPGGRQWMTYRQSEHYKSLDDLLASGGIDSLTPDAHNPYVGQSTYMDVADMNSSDYYMIGCPTCHDPHDASINWDDTHLMDEFTFSPWKNPYTNQTQGKNGSQLRFATVNELCGQCHTIELNTSRNYFLDPSNHTDLACTDCHGYQFTPGHNSTDRFGVTSWVPDAFSELSHDLVAPNDPGDCGLCHGNDNATVWADMQAYFNTFGNVSKAKATYDAKLALAKAKYTEVKAMDGADIDKLANAYALIEEAKALAEATKVTFHNPELGVTMELEQLSLAASKLDDALDDATDAIPEATTTTTTETPTTTTEEPETTTTADGTPAIGFLGVLTILGFAVFFLRKRRKR